EVRSVVAGPGRAGQFDGGVVAGALHGAQHEGGGDGVAGGEVVGADLEVERRGTVRGLVVGECGAVGAAFDAEAAGGEIAGGPFLVGPGGEGDGGADPEDNASGEKGADLALTVGVSGRSGHREPPKQKNEQTPQAGYPFL